MSENNSGQVFIPRVAYRDQRSAMEWLTRAFGFETVMFAKDSAGKVVHAEMRFGRGRFYIGSEWENIKAPGSLGGANTQTLCVRLESGIDARCEHARAAGGKIVQELQDQFHGDRTYRVIDLEGHAWTFSQKLREVTDQEMEAAIPGMEVWRSGQIESD